MKEGRVSTGFGRGDLERKGFSIVGKERKRRD